MNKALKAKRIELCYSQSDLAEKAQLSLRTIQRVESGETIPKGHTLNAIVKALGVDIASLNEPSSELKTRIQLVNIATIVFCFIPFLSMLIPTIIWQKSKKEHPVVDETGRQILNVQILWSLTYVFAVALSPFIQNAFFPNIPLVLFVVLFFIIINLFVIGWVAHLINIEQSNLFPWLLRLI